MDYVIPNHINIGSLHVALVALGYPIDGITVRAAGERLTLHYQGNDAALTPPQIAGVQAVLDAHDPVFLAVDKGTIAADGIDTATITVSAPKTSAAGVTLLVNGSPVPVTLSSGAGTVQIASADPATITVSVQNPANRTTDTISIKAV